MKRFMAATSILGVGLTALLLAGPALAQVQLPLAPNLIPQFAQPLPVLGATGIPFTLGTQVVDPSNPVQQNVDITLCEFQTSILPVGTVINGVPAAIAPLTWVWGYQEGAACVALPGHSYLGPVVLATRGIPTQMTFKNLLPDAAAANVQAYKTSTDQTVIWGDPLSLIANATALPITELDGTAVWLGPIANPTPPPPLLVPEINECYLAARDFHLGIILTMPQNCLDNYGYNAIAPPLPLRPPGAYIAPVPAAVHIHGGEVPAVLDGGPDSWWTPNGIYGHGFYSRGGVMDAAAGKAVYVYPNGQEAAPIWFHDHILGATRLNVYAGIAGGYMITDSPLSSPNTLPPGLLPLGLDRKQTGALMNGTLDLAAGADEVLIPLIIQDRMFDTNGQLYFPAVGINPEHPYWIPEFVGDTIAVNGAVWPSMKVEPKRYRFLVLNGSNARVYELGFVNQKIPKKGQPPPAVPPIFVIGNDQGYLDKPQMISPAAIPPANKLVIMPGERYEIIVDFKNNAGNKLFLTNTAAVPYPNGAPVNPLTDGMVMQFKVGSLCPSNQCFTNDTSYNPASNIGLRYKLDAAGTKVADPIIRLSTANVQKTRRLTLNEVLTPAGPLEILVNNTLYDGSEARPAYTDPVTGQNDFTPVTSLWNTSYYSELPHEGETELWEIVNLTVDAHPMHPHLVAFQVLDRQAFDTIAYPAAYDASFPGGVFLPGFGPPLDYTCGQRWQYPDPVDPINNPPVMLPQPPRGVLDSCVLGGNPDPALFLVGAPVPPSPQEIGWKDTVMAPPGMVTRVLVRFGKTTADVAAPVGYDFSPAEGHGYVWHCHIIDHEDNEMMRPYQVIADPAAVRTFVSPGNY